MGWGLPDLINLGRDLIGSGGSAGGVAGGQAEQINEARRGSRVVSSWTSSLDPGDLPEMVNYTGEAYNPERIGWPVTIGVEAPGTTGNPPEGTFFIGHAPPGLIMETFRMTQGGVPLELDYEQRAGFVARLIQRDPDGLIIYIDGFEIGVERESGRIVREDLRLPAKSPLTAEARYGGPIEPFWPLYIDISPYGDIGAVSGIDDLQVQVSATFLCQEPPAFGQRRRIVPTPPSPYYDPRNPATTVNKSKRTT